MYSACVLPRVSPTTHALNFIISTVIVIIIIIIKIRPYCLITKITFFIFINIYFRAVQLCDCEIIKRVFLPDLQVKDKVKVEIFSERTPDYFLTMDVNFLLL